MSVRHERTKEAFWRRFPRPKALIGMIPLPPLPGYPDHPGMEAVIAAALADLAALEAAGFDAVLIENDNDQPHTIGVSATITEAFAEVVGQVIARASIPVGMEIIYDMEATVAVAHHTGCAFVRLDVFADAVATRWGEIPAPAEAVSMLRRELSADDLLFFTDVQVKHARLPRERSLAESAADSLALGSDGLIVTGDWTGMPPSLDDMQTAREAATGAPIIIGSGLTATNAPELLGATDAAIVGTALKTGGRIDGAKALALAAVVEQLRAGA